MTIEEVKELINSVHSMALDPPWCENVEQLKKWVEGFEECQRWVIQIIENKVKGKEKDESK